MSAVLFVPAFSRRSRPLASTCRTHQTPEPGMDTAPPATGGTVCLWQRRSVRECIDGCPQSHDSKPDPKWHFKTEGARSTLHVRERNVVFDSLADCRTLKEVTHPLNAIDNINCLYRS